MSSSAPLIPLRDVVVYPHMVIPLFVGRQKSIDALDAAMQQGKQVVLVAQKSADQDEPTQDDLYSIGTLANIVQLLRLPDGTVKVLVEGAERVTVQAIEEDSFATVIYELIDIEPVSGEDSELDVMMQSVLNLFEQYVKLNRKIPSEVLNALNSIEEAGRLADTVAAHLALKLEHKQEILEQLDVRERLEKLLGQLEAQLDLIKIEKKIRGRVKGQMEKSQREYYLNEQIKAIQKELGDNGSEGDELEELRTKIDEANMPEDVLAKADSEFNKLKMMAPMSAEAGVTRNYLDWLIKMPWSTASDIHHDLDEAQDTLDSDHFGLDKVKERIIEYLAVQKRVGTLKGPILCLVGPPGVGKTSLGRSIAAATGREYARVALGGVRDEAEIRGHRRTYIGAMPGKVLQKMGKVGVRNPLFLLDEIDKMTSDFRGDPSSALLEVLDPEQNSTFNDHYLEVDFDLSDVMFVCTANSLNIPAPLLDRMEVIRLSGYTEDEKVSIAKNYLLPKQLERNGVADGELTVSEGAIRDVVRYYTREAGVRSLEREMAKICRKAVTEVVKAESSQKAKADKADKADKTDKAASKSKKPKTVKVTARNLEKYLGVQRYRFGAADAEDRIGQVTGLAWTEVGGDLLTIEAATVPGKGKLTHTGHLGDVMKESIQAALTVVRSRSALLGIDPECTQKSDIHIHVPEGATPKDGPSAGIAMCTALVSALTQIPVCKDIAMTGEITLRGEVLPIGGLKEKLLAAHRGGIKRVLIPHENVKDLQEIPENIKANLDIIPVRWIDQVLENALPYLPTADSAAGDKGVAEGVALDEGATGDARHH